MKEKTVNPVRFSRSIRAGFTLIELTVIIVVASILATGAIPAISSLTGARAPAAADEVARLLENARDHALLSGEPSGLEIGVSEGSIRAVRVAPGTSEVSVRTDALGSERPTFVVSGEFPGVEIESLLAFDGMSGDATLWFGSDGVPELRDEVGTLLGEGTHDAELTFSTGYIIRVRTLTGMVE